jgi:branched-chain amino acid transport system ATP-binding protein
MLRIEALRTAYGAVVALDDVSFDVPESSITAVLGANGAGKSSLLRTVSGLVRPRSGRVLLSGRDITRAAPEEIARLGVAHVPEGRGVIAELSVEENLRLGGLWRRDTAALGEVYELFGALRERRAQPASTLSGGERQMLVLGRALMARPRLLLLDEPSLGLAPKIAAQIVALLRDLRERTGLTVLLVEQNARSALSVADRGVVLALGRIVAAETPEVLAGDDQLRHAYLGF